LFSTLKQTYCYDGARDVFWHAKILRVLRLLKFVMAGRQNPSARHTPASRLTNVWVDMPYPITASICAPHFLPIPSFFGVEKNVPHPIIFQPLKVLHLFVLSNFPRVLHTNLFLGKSWSCVKEPKFLILPPGHFNSALSIANSERLWGFFINTEPWTVNLTTWVVMVFLDTPIFICYVPIWNTETLYYNPTSNRCFKFKQYNLSHHGKTKFCRVEYSTWNWY